MQPFRLAAGLRLTVILLALRADERTMGAPPSAKRETAQTVKIQGRVLGPDGKPVKGARLYSARVPNVWPRNNAVVTLAQPDPTGADGRFHITTNRPGPDELAYLIAHAAGLGVNWIDLSEDEGRQEVTLRLPKDVPITGRIVNTEGRPVAGVSVSVAEIRTSANDKLDDYLAGWLRDFRTNHMTAEQKGLLLPLDGILGTATTDKDGRFTLRGAGSERIVYVALSGAGVARSTPWIITRSGFDTKPYNAVLRKQKDADLLALNRFLGLFPPSFTFIAEAGKTIEGVVKDAATGKPLPGCRLITQTSYGHGITAVSNAEGKYRIDGLAKRVGGHYYLSVHSPRGSAYRGRSLNAADTVGFAPIRLDIELAKGAIVTGQVVDRQTGKPVRCYVRSVPLPDNRPAGSLALDRGDADGGLEIDADGRFRLTAIPGKTLLLARVVESEKLSGQRLYGYRRAVPDPDHKDIFQRSGETWRVTTAAGITEFLDIENAVKVIDAKKEGENRVEMFVNRGATTRIVVQDGEGKPLAGAWVTGLTDTEMMAHKLPEATATVYALNPAKPQKVPFLPALMSVLNPDKPRTLAFFHAEKKLGGTATVRGDEKGPVVVKLSPLGKISGRLLDGDGNPLEGVQVSIEAQSRIGRMLYRYAAPTGKPVRTDKDGRFRMEGVVPDLAFRLNLRKERSFLVGEPRLGVKQMKSGETLDLGNIRVKPAR